MNLLWFCTDEHRADHLGCYGNRTVRSPHIDSLATTSIRFAHSYVANPVCSPNRSSFFTGLYPSRHGVVENGHFLDPCWPTLPSLLRDAGFATHASGKLHLAPYYIADGSPAPEHAFYESRQRWAEGHAMPPGAYGFDQHYYVGSHTSVVFGQYKREMDAKHPGTVEAFTRPHAVRDDGAWSCWTADLPSELHYNTRIADETIGFMEKQSRAKQNFFAWCSFPDPHGPFVALREIVGTYLGQDPGIAPIPEPTAEHGWPEGLRRMLAKNRGLISTSEHFRTITAHIYAMVEHLDAQIGRVLARVRELGLEEDTLVVFTSDHGHWHGDHGLGGKGGLLTHGLVRTPLLVRVPGSASAGKTSASLVSAVDLMPTLLELLGQPVPDGLDGRSFAGLFDSPSTPHREHVRIEWQETALHAQAVQIRTAHHALTHYAPSGETLLSDLRQDPSELHNLWPKHAHSQAARRLETTLRTELMASLNPRLRPLARC